MATVSSKVLLGERNNVIIGSVPDKQYAEVNIMIGDDVIFKIKLSAGEESFVWNLSFDTDNFDFIFNNYFSHNTSSITAKMTVTVYFSTGVKNLFRGGKYDILIQLTENERTRPLINSVKLSAFSDNGFEKYIQGKTKVRCNVYAEGKYNAEIKSVNVMVDGSSCKKTDDGFVSSWLCSSGYRNVAITVIDTRGFKNTYTEQIYVEPYSPPIIVPPGTNASIIYGRYNPNTSKFDDANGTQCKIQFAVCANFIKDINGFFEYSYSYKTADETEFTYTSNAERISFSSSIEQTEVELLIDDNTVTDEQGKQVGPFDVEKEYLVELTITDSLGEKVTKTVRLDVLECIWHIGRGGKQFAVGKYATKNKVLDSAWPIHTDKDISAGGTITSLGTPISVEIGGTGANNADEARENLGFTLANLGLNASKDDINLVSGLKNSGVTSQNIKYLYGVKSNIQDQLEQKSEIGHAHNEYALSGHTHSGYSLTEHKHNVEDITTTPNTVCENTFLITIINEGEKITLVEEECWATVWGKVCEIYITFEYGSALSAGDFANITVGTLAAAYRPNHYVGCHSGGAGIVVSGEITDKGVLKLSSASSDIKANEKISLTATYLLP